MLEAFSTTRNRNRTFILLGICGVLAATAATIGISDNPPGLLVAYLSATILVVAFVHPWKASQPFRRLLYTSGLGFVVFAVLHNLFEGLAATLGATGLVEALLEIAGGGFFVIATLLCPPGFLVGAVGAVVMSKREGRSHPDTAGTAA